MSSSGEKIQLTTAMAEVEPNAIGRPDPTSENIQTSDHINGSLTQSEAERLQREANEDTTRSEDLRLFLKEMHEKLKEEQQQQQQQQPSTQPATVIPPVFAQPTNVSESEYSLTGHPPSVGVPARDFEGDLQPAVRRSSGPIATKLGNPPNRTGSVTGPLVSALTNQFDFRPVAMAGAVLSTVAFLISAFANSIDLLIGGFGILGVGHWFQQSRPLAVGLALCGSGVGCLLGAQAVPRLVDWLTWRGALIVMAATSFQALRLKRAAREAARRDAAMRRAEAELRLMEARQRKRLSAAKVAAAQAMEYQQKIQQQQQQYRQISGAKPSYPSTVMPQLDARTGAMLQTHGMLRGTANRPRMGTMVTRTGRGGRMFTVTTAANQQGSVVVGVNPTRPTTGAPPRGGTGWLRSRNQSGRNHAAKRAPSRRVVVYRGSIMQRIIEEKRRQRTTSVGSLDGMVITRDNELIAAPLAPGYDRPLLSASVINRISESVARKIELKMQQQQTGVVGDITGGSRVGLSRSHLRVNLPQVVQEYIQSQLSVVQNKQSMNLVNPSTTGLLSSNLPPQVSVASAVVPMRPTSIVEPSGSSQVDTNVNAPPVSPVAPISLGADDGLVLSPEHSTPVNPSPSSVIPVGQTAPAQELTQAPIVSLKHPHKPAVSSCTSESTSLRHTTSDASLESRVPVNGGGTAIVSVPTADAVELLDDEIKAHINARLRRELARPQHKKDLFYTGSVLHLGSGQVTRERVFTRPSAVMPPSLAASGGGALKRHVSSVICPSALILSSNTGFKMRGLRTSVAVTPQPTTMEPAAIEDTVLTNFAPSDQLDTRVSVQDEQASLTVLQPSRGTTYTLARSAEPLGGDPADLVSRLGDHPPYAYSYVIPFLLLPDLLAELNWTLADSGFVISAIGVGNTVGRLVATVFVSLKSILVVELLGLERLTNSFGYMLLFQGLAAGVGPPVAVYTIVMFICRLIRNSGFEDKPLCSGDSEGPQLLFVCFKLCLQASQSKSRILRDLQLDQYAPHDILTAHLAPVHNAASMGFYFSGVCLFLSCLLGCPLRWLSRTESSRPITVVSHPSSTADPPFELITGPRSVPDTAGTVSAQVGDVEFLIGLPEQTGVINFAASISDNFIPRVGELVEQKPFANNTNAEPATGVPLAATVVGQPPAVGSSVMAAASATGAAQNLVELSGPPCILATINEDIPVVTTPTQAVADVVLPTVPATNTDDISMFDGLPASILPCALVIPSAGVTVPVVTGTPCATPGTLSSQTATAVEVLGVQEDSGLEPVAEEEEDEYDDDDVQEPEIPYTTSFQTGPSSGRFVVVTVPDSSPNMPNSELPDVSDQSVKRRKKRRKVAPKLQNGSDPSSVIVTTTVPSGSDESGQHSQQQGSTDQSGNYGDERPWTDNFKYVAHRLNQQSHHLEANE
ncbi:hypothetical protein X801_03674, partial [Opisthorchis viverrini]